MSLVNFQQRSNIVYATGTVSQAGNTLAIPAEANKQIYMVSLRIQNENGSDQKFLLKEGTTTKQTLFTSTKSSGLDRVSLWVFPENTEFNIDSSTANTYSYTVGYYYA